MHISSGVLLSHKKKYWDISGDVSWPRVFHTEWYKPEREKQILSINPYMWNLEKSCSWTYLQGRGREWTVAAGWAMNWEVGIDMCALPLQNSQWQPAVTKSRELSSVPCGLKRVRWGGVGSWGRGYMYTYSWIHSHSRNRHNLVKQWYLSKKRHHFSCLLVAMNNVV